MTSPYLVLLLGESSLSSHAGYLDLYKSFRSAIKKTLSSVDPGIATNVGAPDNKGERTIFTRHGEDHVDKVIESASALAETIGKENSLSKLSSREAFLLLCAICIHDIANIENRQNHTLLASDYAAKYTSHFGGTENTTFISDIAMAHGGDHELYGADTIAAIKEYGEGHPRLKLLAGILRLADELSEEPARIHWDLISLNPLKKKTALAVAYCASFCPWSLSKGVLYITYELPQEEIDSCMANHGGVDVFVDELECRIDKLEKEARYCCQYVRKHFNIEIISISISKRTRLIAGKLLTRPLTFNLDLLKGYPATHSSLFERSHELAATSASSLRQCLNNQINPTLVETPAGMKPTSSDSKEHTQSSQVAQSQIVEPSKEASLLKWLKTKLNALFWKD